MTDKHDLTLFGQMQACSDVISKEIRNLPYDPAGPHAGALVIRGRATELREAVDELIGRMEDAPAPAVFALNDDPGVSPGTPERMAEAASAIADAVRTVPITGEVPNKLGKSHRKPSHSHDLAFTRL